MSLKHKDMGQVRETSSSVNRPKPETYVVDDANTEPTIDDRLAQFNAPAELAVPEKTGAEFPLPPKKEISKALEKLIFIGRLKKDVEIDGITFEVSTLTNKEHGEIVRAMYRFEDAADLFTVRVLTLANAIKKIDGVSLDDIDVDGEFESHFHKRMSVIDYLQLSVVEKLFDEYEELVKEEEVVDGEDKELKNS